MKKLTIKNFVKSVLVASSVVVAPMMVVDSVFGAESATPLEYHGGHNYKDIAKFLEDNKDHSLTDEELVCSVGDSPSAIGVALLKEIEKDHPTLGDLLCFAYCTDYLNQAVCNALKINFRDVLEKGEKDDRDAWKKAQGKFEEILERMYQGEYEKKVGSYRWQHKLLKGEKLIERNYEKKFLDMAKGLVKKKLQDFANQKIHFASFTYPGMDYDVLLLTEEERTVKNLLCFVIGAKGISSDPFLVQSLDLATGSEVFRGIGCVMGDQSRSLEIFEEILKDAYGREYNRKVEEYKKRIRDLGNDHGKEKELKKEFEEIMKGVHQEWAEAAKKK